MAFNLDNVVLPILLLLGVVMIVLGVVGSLNAQLLLAQNLFIVIIVLSVFSMLLYLLGYFFKKKAKNNYDINAGGSSGAGNVRATGKAGQENRAFKVEEGRAAAPSNSAAPGQGQKSDKWVSNYVPYGEYPAGSAGDPNNPQPEQNGESKWKKAYVPYEAGQEENGEEKRDISKAEE